MSWIAYLLLTLCAIAAVFGGLFFYLEYRLSKQRRFPRYDDWN